MICLRFICVVSLCSWMILYGSGENICPPVTELLSQQTVIADVNGSDFSSFIWRRPSDDEGVLTCEIAKNQCIQTRPGYSGTVSSSIRTSHLTISSTQKRDSGMWTLEAGTTDVDVCNLVTARKPNCNINSNIEADDLDLGNNLTLTVNAMGYFCSKVASFSLTTGDVTQILLQNHTVDDGTDKDSYDKVLNTTFDISLTRFGDVTLNFTCESRTWSLTCEGVLKLIKSRPKCNISSNRDTTDLDPGDVLTLTADIKGYYCPRSAGFKLTTGKVSEVLADNLIVEDVTDTTFNKTLNMTRSRNGGVKLNYTCDGDNWVLVCGGVTALGHRDGGPRVGPRDHPGLNPGTIAGIVIAVLVVVIVAAAVGVYIYCRKRNSANI